MVGPGSPTTSTADLPFYVGTDQRIYSPETSNHPLPTAAVMKTANGTSAEITSMLDGNNYGHIYYPSDVGDLREYYFGATSGDYAIAPGAHLQ
jgi:hypothetical protein